MKKSVAIIIALVMLISLVPIGMVSAEEVITVTSSVQNGAIVMSTQKVTLTFSEAIDPATISGITFEGGTITPAVKPETGDTVVEFTIPQVATIGNYKLTVPNTVTNPDGTNTVVPTEFTYNVVNLLFDMDIEGKDGAYVMQTDETAIVDATPATKHNLESMPAPAPEEGADPVLESDTEEKYALSTVPQNGVTGETNLPSYHQEGNIEYLTFAVPNAAGTGYVSKNPRVAVPMNPELNIASKDKLTFEAWIRPKRAPGVDIGNTDDSTWMGFGKGGNTPWDDPEGVDKWNANLRAFSASWYYLRNLNNGCGLTVQPDMSITSGANANSTGIQHGYSKDLAEGDSNIPANEEVNGEKIYYPLNSTLNSMSEFDGKWAHIVITREYVGEVNGKHRWSSVLYVNGCKRTTTARDLLSKSNYNEDYSTLVIGSDNKYAAGFHGDISTFKMYDGLLDEAIVRQHYSDSNQNYYNTDGDGITKVLEVKVDENENIVSSSDADAPAPKRLSERVASTTIGASPEIVTENGVSYMKFASVEEGALVDPKARLYYKLNDINFTDQDEITVTAWARMPYTDDITAGMPDDDALYDSGKYTTLLQLSVNPNQRQADGRNIYRVALAANADPEKAESFQHSKMIATIDDTSYAEKNNIANLGDVYNYGDEWAYYAITKTWVGTDGSSETGKFVFKTYINKELVATSELPVADRHSWSAELGATPATNIDNAVDYITIGGTNGSFGGATFLGDIAQFSLYSGELTAAQVADEYYATCGTFIDGPILRDANIKTQQGEDVVVLDKNSIKQADNVLIQSESIINYEEENAPFVVLAVYGDAECTKLIGLKVVPATLNEDKTVTLTDTQIDGFNAGEVANVRIYVWDSVTQMGPLMLVYYL